MNTSNPRKALESVSLFFVKSFENGPKGTEMSSCVRAGVVVLLVRYKKKYFRAKFILFPGRDFPAAAGVEDWLAPR